VRYGGKPDFVAGPFGIVSVIGTYSRSGAIDDQDKARMPPGEGCLEEFQYRSMKINRRLA
jgi:hypothetical protein